MKPNISFSCTIRAVISLIFLFGFSIARATDFVVSNGNNAGAGSLRQAILSANADAAAPHTITFTVVGIINITSSLPAITRQVTIEGNSSVTINGLGSNNTNTLIVFSTGSGGSTIKNLKITNGGVEPVRLAVALSNITIDGLHLSGKNGTAAKGIHVMAAAYG